LADELKKELGLESNLTPGGGGVFDVSVDGKTVFSKKLVGRFPEPGEVVALLKKP
jgi:selenoprotein W-related protein